MRTSIVHSRAVRSNRNRIVYGYRIECFWSNRIEWIFRFSIRFDSIWFGQDSEGKKWKLLAVKRNKFTKSKHKLICLLFRTSWWIPLQRMANFSMAIIYLCVLIRFPIKSNRKWNWINIESISNRMVSGPSQSKMETNSIWQPWCIVMRKATVAGWFRTQLPLIP